MRLLHIILASSIYILTCSSASAVIIEPDNYAAGTDLSTVSPLVTLSTTGGAPVYASTIHRTTGTGELAAGGYSTGPLGDSVFSRSPDTNNEWYYWPSMDPNDPDGLVIDFQQQVSSFSLLFAELFQDAGCCTSDPVYLYIYAPDGTFIESLDMESSSTKNYLGNPGDLADAWPYWQFEYSSNLVGKVIVGGESEPTSIDRLQFTVVPVPAALWLFASGLIGLVGVSRGRKR